MRSERGRKKKLVVAFHFQYANQTAWRCDTCRKAGLEKRRRCGWLPHEASAPEVVWARRQIAVDSCPTSYVTAASLEFLETFHALKLFGTRDYRALPARQVEASMILENELRSERNHEHT